MKKYDRESNTRVWEGRPKLVLSALLAVVALYCIYDTLFTTGLVQQARLALFVGIFVVVGYLVFPAKKGMQHVNTLPWYDIIIIVLTVLAYGYFVLNAKSLIEMRISKYEWYHIAIAIWCLISLIELCRRCVGLPIICVAAVFIVYALFIYQSSQMAFLRRLQSLLKSLVFSTEGILSTPINTCSKFIAVFIIFGAFLERTGISDFFINLANCAVGKYSGGPAKVAVISSALCGMVSGSSVGNTVTTGSVTIPMMKKAGYKGEFAGAVEAAASTGGQIMPPIMGAAAFLMADFIGVSYSSIIVRAILPAILYFTGIFISVHLEAKKLGLSGIPKELLPEFRKLVKKCFLLLPLIALILFISTNIMTIQKAAIIAIGIAILVSLLNRDNPISLRKIFEALSAGAQSTITVTVACGMAGIIAGCITMTGLASVLKAAIVTASGGYKLPALFMTMLCCIVLGMGVPTTANYCIMASTCAPILVEMGVPMMAAHMFVFYFGIVADITPPVALAAYAGSAIAHSTPMKTALNATKLAIAAFIIPYIFALNPAMLFIDTTPVEFILIVVTSAVGMFGVSMGLEGYIYGHLNPPLRILAIAGGLALIYPGVWTDVIGMVVVIGIIVLQRVLHGRDTSGTTPHYDPDAE
ncbi:MAG: TRAP transporter permease [Butyricicoccus sp.]|nr:TRAP transporter permease [Butyricicoccus sp.]